MWRRRSAPRPVAAMRRNGFNSDVRLRAGFVLIEIKRVGSVSPPVEHVNDSDGHGAVRRLRYIEHQHVGVAAIVGDGCRMTRDRNDRAFDVRNAADRIA